MPSTPSEITDDTRKNLVRMLRVAFPHPSFPDGPYERTADAILAQLDADLWHRLTLTEGLLSLDTAAQSRGGTSFLELGDQDALAMLRDMEEAEFFVFVRGVTVTTLYDDREVWGILGYEGSSFEKGGYIHRGFDDLDWLPDVRNTEYDGPDKLVEVADHDMPATATTATTATTV